MNPHTRSERYPSTRAKWRAWVGSAGRAVALVAVATLAASTMAEVPERLGARLVLFRAVALPAAVLLQPLMQHSAVLGVVLVIGAVGYLASVSVGGLPALPSGVRTGTPGLLRELYCWLHAMALLPVSMVLIVSNVSRFVAPAIVLLYALHWTDSPGLAALRKVLGGLVNVTSWALLAVVLGVLGAIASSHAVLAGAVTVLAAAFASAPGGEPRAMILVWAVGALLIASCDQWLFIALAALDTLVAYRLGFFELRVLRGMRVSTLAVLLASQLLLGRGIGLLMGFQSSDRWTIELQPGVHVVMPYTLGRDPSLGEHLTLAAPSCEAGGAIAGAVSTSRWVGGGPDAIQPKLRRIDSDGEIVARGTDVLEPSYGSSLDCARSRLWIGAAMGMSVAALDSRTLALTERVELPCRQSILAVSWLPRRDWLAVGCGPTVFLDARTLATVATVDTSSFDARERADDIELASAAGARRFAVRTDSTGTARLESIRSRTWAAFEAAETRWGPVTSQVGKLVRYEEDSLEPAVERRVGVWIRYLRAHARLPLLTASDYLRGRVYLVRLPDLAIVGDWFVGERPREAWLDDDGLAIWVGSAAGLVRIDVASGAEEN